MEENNDLKKSIQDYIREAEPLANLKSKIMNKNITILLGQTRGGKSTLANYLLDNKCKSVKAEIGKSYKLEILNAGGGPQMGNGPLSVTSIPTVHSTPDGGILIDSPGFEDNRGTPQDIFNAVCVSHIRFANSIKFVLVCYIGDIINDNVKNFTNLLKQMADLVPNIEEIKNSVCIIFTKDDQDLTLEDLTTGMRDILNENLVADKRLLSTWIQNKELIGIFKAPVREGVVVLSELEVNVKNGIDACSYVNVKSLEIKFALAEKSTILLKSMYPYYTDSLYFESEIRRLIGGYIRYFENDRYIFASYVKELAEVQLDLQILNDLITLLPDIIHNLEELKVSLEHLMNMRNLNLSPEFESHFQFILWLDNALLFDEKCRADVIKHYKESMEILSKDIQKVLNNITSEFEDRKNEGISAIFEGVTVGGGVSLTAATFNAARVGLAAMWGAVAGTAVAAEGVTATAGAVTAGTVAATSAFAIGGITVGAAMGSLYWTIKNSIIKRYKTRCDQDRREIEEE